MLNNENTLRHIGLQFFAEEGGNEGFQGEEHDAEEGTGGKSGKTFTQAEVNALLKREKENSKKSLLKELGVEDAKSVKEGLAKYQEILDRDKSDADKAKEDLGKETRAKEEAERRALAAEAKVEVLSAGCKPEYLDDVITLALKRVSEDKDLSTVVKEMKEEPKYSTFFGESDSGFGDSGTGGGSGFRRRENPSRKGGLGSRLGAQVAGNNTKNPYFNN